MNVRLSLVIVLVFLCLLSFGQINISADTTKIRIGEPIQLTIQSEVTENVYFPVLSDTVGAFEVLEQLPVDTTEEYLKQLLTVTVFDSGQYVFRPIPIVVNGDTIFTKKIPIKVFDVLVDTTKQKMYDIKEIESVGYSLKELLFWIIIGLLIFLFVGLIIFLIWWESRKKKRGEAVVRVLLAPHVEALEMLKKMDAKQYLSHGKIKEYYTELSDIFRYYMEGQYSIEAMESITEEIIESLRSLRDFEKEETISIQNFLKQSDLVKFAKWSPAINEIESHRREVERIIIKTSKPIETEQQANDE